LQILWQIVVILKGVTTIHCFEHMIEAIGGLGHEALRKVRAWLLLHKVCWLASFLLRPAAPGAPQSETP
jgi:hypothetical protein